MEWLSSIRTAINYMEEHLTDDISAQDVAARVHLSPFFLQRGFSLMTGYGIGEYAKPQTVSSGTGPEGDRRQGDRDCPSVLL